MATKRKSPVLPMPVRWDKNKAVEESQARLPGVFAWYDSALANPDVPDSVKLGICKEIRECAIGKAQQSVDLTNSDGAFSPMDITVTFDIPDAAETKD